MSDLNIYNTTAIPHISFGELKDNILDVKIDYSKLIIPEMFDKSYEWHLEHSKYFYDPVVGKGPEDWN